MRLQVQLILPVSVPFALGAIYEFLLNFVPLLDPWCICHFLSPRPSVWYIYATYHLHLHTTYFSKFRKHRIPTQIPPLSDRFLDSLFLVVSLPSCLLAN